VCVREREREREKEREREGERKKRDEYQFVFIGNNDFFFPIDSEFICNSNKRKTIPVFLKRKEGDTESMINRCSLFISFLFFSFLFTTSRWFGFGLLLT
jgi:hypothetical protein